MRLDAELDFLNNVGSPQAVVLDPTTGSVALVTSEGAANVGAITKDEWATLVQCAYSGNTPTFSLDPLNPADPEGPLLKCVYSPGTETSPLGAALLDIDVLGKRLCMGAEATSVPAFHNMFDLCFAGRAAPPRSLSRIWFTGDRIRLRRSGSAIAFDGTGIQVKTERMLRTQTGIESSHGVEDPELATITRFMTEHIAAFQHSHNEFEHLARLMRAYAVARFMAETHMPADQWLNYRPREATDNPMVMLAAKLSREQSRKSRRRVAGGYLRTTLTRRITLVGGVNMEVVIPDDQHDPVAADLSRRVAAEIRRGATHRFALPSTGKVAVAISPADFKGN